MFQSTLRYAVVVDLEIELKRQFSYVKIRYRGLKKHGPIHHAVCAVQFLDGVQQIDASRSMNTPEIKARAIYWEKKVPHLLIEK